MNSFNVYRPLVRVSPAIVGFVAGVNDPDAKRAGNIAARLKLAITARAAAVEALGMIAAGEEVPGETIAKFATFAPNAKDAERVAWRTIAYLRAARKLGALPTHLETFLGLVPEVQPEVCDTRTLDQLLAEAERKSLRGAKKR